MKLVFRIYKRVSRTRDTFFEVSRDGALCYMSVSKTACKQWIRAQFAYDQAADKSVQITEKQSGDIIQVCSSKAQARQWIATQARQ